MAKTDFILEAEEQQVHPDKPDTALYYSLRDGSGAALATGMSEAEAVDALHARGHRGETVLVRSGALGHSADATTTVGAVKSGD